MYCICIYIYIYVSICHVGKRPTKKAKSITYIYIYVYVSYMYIHIDICIITLCRNGNQKCVYVHIFVSVILFSLKSIWFSFRLLRNVEMRTRVVILFALKVQVSFAKEPCKIDYILQKRPIILRSPPIVA